MATGAICGTIEMKKNIPAFRIIFMASFVLVCLGILVGRLWWLEVVQYDKYAKLVKTGSALSVRLPAVRGEILDRNGIPLVENRASFEVNFYLPDMVRAYEKEHKTRAPVLDVKYRHYDLRGNAEDRAEVDIPAVVKDTAISKLEGLGLAADYNAERLQVHYRNNTLVPFNYRQDLDFDTMAKFMENNVGLPGLNAEVKPVRHYPYGALAAQLLGYVGPAQDINKKQREELEQGRRYSFYQPDMEGKAQVELAMDKYLRGQPGARVLRTDAKSQIIEDSEQLDPPQPGDNVYLTIDARLQYVVEDTLRIAGRAACVVVDVNNGDILAMASVPSFDPNKFVPSVDRASWNQLVKDETNPLTNRTINAYVPGSTYKILTALAIESKGLGERRYHCAGSVSYGNTVMKCWIASKGGSHGSLDLEDGIKHSCNAYFFQAGNAASIEEIDRIGALLGFGEPSGLPLSGENPGILDGPAHLLSVNPQDRWRDGLTANVSIGQGSVLVTPVQMAMLAATVANGGTCYYPRIIDKVVARDGTVVLQEPAKVRSNLVKDAGMTAEQIEHVRHGMWRVVNEDGGTARKARLRTPGVQSAGKTGTAQNWRINAEGQRVQDNNTLFIAFAPYDKPKYAICVLVQGGYAGGMVPAPIAGKILDEALAIEKGDLKVQVAALEPAIGNFKQIKSVDFEGDIPVATSSDVETVDDVTSSSADVTQVAMNAASPVIRDQADDAGRVQEPKKKRGLFDFIFNGGNKKPKPDNRRSGAPPSHR
jgi:penicillin-binding protein 2